MIDRRFNLLRLLADGRFHSGDVIGGDLGISRGAVWKEIGRLREIGIEINALPGRGYQLAQPLELLDRDTIIEEIGAAQRSRMYDLEIIDELDSTNRLMSGRALSGAASGCVVLAEHQTAGRGRNGRPWISPMAQNIYMSVLWRFRHSPQELSGLALIFGIAIARTLSEFAIEDVRLKWPNDVVCRGRKLAGVLIELASEATGPCSAVVGIGLNVNMHSPEAARIDQPWVDLKSISHSPISRNKLAGRLITNALAVLVAFEQDGFNPFSEEWSRYDMLRGLAVQVNSSGSVVTGVAEGVADDGALLLRCNGNQRKIYSGEAGLVRDGH